MSKQNGIDILCDAAGSDLVLSPPEPRLAADHAQQQRQQQQPQPPPAKRAKRSVAASSSSSSSSSNLVCHICHRVYERADHLTRHLRSHENARPYECTRCEKRFNRADLLTRHEATHDRDIGKSKTSIKRSDRATQACEACAAAKAKCDDQRPCGRCEARGVVCQNPTRNSPYKKYTDPEAPASAVSEASSMPPVMENNHSMPTGQMYLDGGLPTPAFLPGVLEPDTSMVDPSIMGPLPDGMAFFSPMQNLWQDMDFGASWDMDFNNFSIPHIVQQEVSPQSSNHAAGTPYPPLKDNRVAFRDPSVGHAAFKRYSPWLWEPKNLEDYVQQQKEGLTVDEQALSRSPAFDRMMDNTPRKMLLKSQHRDRIFSMVLAQNKDVRKVPSFPTLELLNYLFHAHFVQEEQQINSWIHASSLDIDTAMPELLAAIIANGATCVSIPAVWQFGLALHEVIRLALANEFERRNASTRNLGVLQASLMHLEIGKWSGFKRKMEIAESFLQPHLTMLRRAHMFSMPIDSAVTVPCASDSPETVEHKWRDFISRESWKRLLLQSYLHDAETSMGVQTNPLLSYTELKFTLPASKDLWRAPNAEAWRRIYLTKKTLTQPMPLVSEVMHNINILDDLSAHVDLELCHGVLLCGMWGQVAAFRETTRFYATAPSHSNHNHNHSTSTHGLWLRSQHQELYTALASFATIIHTSSSRLHSAQLSVTLELCLMVLHVAPDELQRFAGQSGEDEARRAAATLDDGWARAPEARYAIWHAGQVLSNARRLPPATLRRFNAIAVYLASLTLWVYGLLNAAAARPEAHDPQLYDAASSAAVANAPKLVMLDGEETMDTKAFLQFERGLPALTTSRGGVEPLSSAASVLAIARDIFRENFPVQSEPLPPLVESLGNLLRDLGGGNASLSRVGSRMASRLGSEEK